MDGCRRVCSTREPCARWCALVLCRANCEPRAVLCCAVPCQLRAPCCAVPCRANCEPRAVLCCAVPCQLRAPCCAVLCCAVLFFVSEGVYHPREHLGISTPLGSLHHLTHEEAHEFFVAPLKSFEFARVGIEDTLNNTFNFR